MYFWRTVQQQEIDLIEEDADGIYAYELKWNVKDRGKISSSFLKNYAGTRSSIITPANVEEPLL